MAQPRDRTSLRPFDVSSSSDPEAAAVVAEVIDSGVEHRVFFSYGTRVVDLQGGETLMRKDASWSRRVLFALLEQAAYWETERERIDGENETELAIVGGRPLSGATEARGRLSIIGDVMTLLGRRRMPMTDDDLTKLIELSIERLKTFHGEVEPSVSVRQAEYAARQRELSRPVIDTLTALRCVLDGEYDASKLQIRIDGLVSGDHGDDSAAAPPPGASPPPARVGRDDVLVVLKVRLGMLPPETDAGCETEIIGPDRFPLRADSPLEQEHAVLSAFFESRLEERDYIDPALDADAVGQGIMAMSPGQRGRVYLAACERAAWAHCAPDLGEDGSELWQPHYAASSLPDAFAKTTLAFDRDGLFDGMLLGSATYRKAVTLMLLEQTQASLAGEQLTAGERHVLHRLRCVSIGSPPMGICPPTAKTICAMLGEPDGFWLVPGEHWTDALHADLAAMDAATRKGWHDVLRLAATATSAKPASKWRTAAVSVVQGIGVEGFRRHLARWCAEVPRGRSVRMLGREIHMREPADTINEGNGTILRGLVWMVALHAVVETPRDMADLLLTSIKKVPGVGPRAVKVANACVWALGEMASHPDEAIRDGALGQLARLKARVTFKTTLKAIEKALDTAAAEAGISREELEELGIPAFGFEEGVLRQRLGEAEAELRVDRNKVVIQWTNDKGKRVKAAPAAVRRDHKDAVKELKRLARDAEGILLAGRERLDTVYLADKTWPLGDWRERYLDHGLLGPLVRRLIWLVDDTPVMFDERTAVDVKGKATTLKQTADVRLWHPVGREPDEVQAWRRQVEEREITQPFKQAHREVYVLTDAERATRVYSNRYAAHILKQHQFNALCGARGWSNSLRLLVDDEYPPASREITAHGLRAEFWIEGAGDDYGRDTTDAGTFLYLATDQVRFYRMAAASNTAHAGGGGYRSSAFNAGDANVNDPVPLEEIPPLVLSEILRDVDLFVGVSSVGNDASWADGGPDGLYREYWQGYAFGELSATARTRKDALQRLIPRLKIAGRCSFEDKFLVVEGSLRTYKIHLGSGNILMKPNDQYLCIVPQSHATGAAGKVFLPFEGDRTMGIVLSKAFMLADDVNISDRTILSQIRR